MFNKIDKNWTLFLDRDGVINQELKDDYVKNLQQFTFFDGVLESMPVFEKLFGTIVMVTNQKGIGRGIMTLDDLNEIHQYMMENIVKQGGRIDKIYYCPDMDNDSVNRKPNPGMAFQAKEDFPQIDFSKSIMVGNKMSDMQFGRNAGMHTVFVATTNPHEPFPNPYTDMRFDDLQSFAKFLGNGSK